MCRGRTGCAGGASVSVLGGGRRQADQCSAWLGGLGLAGWVVSRWAIWGMVSGIIPGSHGSTRTKHSRSRPSNSARFCWLSPAPILAAAAALDFVVVTHA
jgi:hypothetical protein